MQQLPEYSSTSTTTTTLSIGERKPPKSYLAPMTRLLGPFVPDYCCFCRKGEIPKDVYTEEWLLEEAYCGCSMHTICLKAAKSRREDLICPEHGVDIKIISIWSEAIMFSIFLGCCGIAFTAVYLFGRYYGL